MHFIAGITGKNMFQLTEDKNEHIFALALCVERKQQRERQKMNIK